MVPYLVKIFVLYIVSALPPLPSAPSYHIQLPPIQQEGLASFYGAGEKGMHGSITATGEVFTGKDKTCASRTIPLNTSIIVEDVRTGKWTYCRVNDRGPFGARLFKKYGGGWAAVIKRRRHYEVRRRVEGEWQEPLFFDKRPGTYRGVLDMSFQTAKALGVDLDEGLNPVRIRYWDKHLPLSPRVYEAEFYTPLH